MKTDDGSVHAREYDWNPLVTELREIIEDEEVVLTGVYITGSLAYGAGVPNISDVDFVLGISTDEVFEVFPSIKNELEQNTERLLSTVDVPVSDVHIVQLCEPNRAARKAMELQWQGNQLAREHGEETSPVQVYDVLDEKVLDSAR